MSRPLAGPRHSFGTRLALTLALTGTGGALLAALLVNLAFQSRFDSFVSQQQQDREDQLLAVVTVYDEVGERIWSTGDSAMGAEMGQRHQQMMGLGPLGSCLWW